jgi:hypothetical protein
VKTFAKARKSTNQVKYILKERKMQNINFPTSLDQSPLTFGKFMTLAESDLNEVGILQSLKQGFSGAMQSWDKPKEGDPKNYEQYKEKAFEAINKARSMYSQFKDKTGLSMPLALALVAGGIAGGPAAIPMAAIMYFTRKALLNPVLSLAGHAFDKGVEKIKKIDNRITGKPDGEKEPVKENFIIENWTFGADYNNFVIYKSLKDENLINCSFKEWITNPDMNLLMAEGERMNWLMRKIGAGAGHISGLLKSVTKKAYNVVTKGLPSLASWALNNKVSIARAVFLMALGVLLGGGITKVSNYVLGQAMDVVSAVAETTGQVPAAEVTALAKTVDVPAAPVEALPVEVPPVEVPAAAAAAAAAPAMMPAPQQYYAPEAEPAKFPLAHRLLTPNREPIFTGERGIGGGRLARAIFGRR